MLGIVLFGISNSEVSLFPVLSLLQTSSCCQIRRNNKTKVLLKHILKERGLDIRQSTVPGAGLGLFASVDFQVKLGVVNKFIFTEVHFSFPLTWEQKAKRNY